MAGKRKVYVNGRFLRGPITGTSRVAEEILRDWDRRFAADSGLHDRLEVTVLAPPDRKRGLDLATIPIVDAQIVGGTVWELLDLPFLARDGMLVNFANIAPFIHTQSIVYLHDAQLFMQPRSYSAMMRLTHKPLMALAGRTAQRVITVSAFSADMLAKHGVARRDKITIIHNGVDHILRAREEPEAVAAAGLTPLRYVLMFGSGLAYKNTRVVYEAFARMGEDRPLLAVIARDDERERFKNVIGPDSAGITLVSGLSDGGLRALYANALVFAAPSRTEGFAMTQLEALACGCPIVTTPEGSMPEVLGDSVNYADADDPDAWAAALNAFRIDPAKRLRDVARGQHLVAHYTWSRSAAALLLEIERLLAA